MATGGRGNGFVDSRRREYEAPVRVNLVHYATD